jgi:hypothetical protein
MAYYPIAHITSLAFADNAFERARLTPEILHKLRVPGRLHVLPLQFRKSMWNTPICRSTVQTMSGVHTHPARPMPYCTANDALKRLGEVAGYGYLIHYYCFRRWVANEANRKLKFPLYLSQLVANQSVSSQGISLNGSGTGFSATRVPQYSRSTIITIVFVATFKMSSSSDHHKRISAEPRRK